MELRRNPKGYAAKLRKYRKRFDGKLVRKDGLFIPKPLQKLNPAELLKVK